MSNNNAHEESRTNRTDTSATAIEVPLAKIKPSRFNLRPIDWAIVAILVKSIGQLGMLEPILVRSQGEDYEIVFGNHRYEACKQLGLPTILSYIRNLTDEDAFILAESENLHRNQFLNPIREGQGFKMLLERGDTEAEIAERIQRSQQYVSIRLNLLRLEPEIQDLITRGLVGADHGYEISKIQGDPKKRMVLAERCRRDRVDPLTMGELRRMIKEPLEELAQKDSGVETILMQDPAEHLKRLEDRFGDVDQVVKDVTGERETSLNEWVFGRHMDIRKMQRQMSAIMLASSSKRDSCTYYDGDVCQLVTVNSPKIPYALLRKVPDREAWMIRVSHHPEICAACHRYVECEEKDRKFKESQITREDLDEVYLMNY